MTVLASLPARPSLIKKLSRSDGVDNDLQCAIIASSENLRFAIEEFQLKAFDLYPIANHRSQLQHSSGEAKGVATDFGRSFR
jgi:hypothetical protein